MVALWPARTRVGSDMIRLVGGGGGGGVRGRAFGSSDLGRQVYIHVPQGQTESEMMRMT
jgi:hypothetical protein